MSELTKFIHLYYIDDTADQTMLHLYYIVAQHFLLEP